MLKILGYLKPFKFLIFLIFILLFVQANADLALPEYTSRVVNVGIQQGGIVNAVPEVIRKTELDKLKSFMAEPDQRKVEDHYILLNADNPAQNDLARSLRNEPRLNKEPLLQLVTSDKKVIEDLNDIMGKPILLVNALAMEKASPVQGELIRQNIDAKIKTMPESMITQAAVAYIKKEYQIMGIDTNRLQNNYILFTGLKMLLIALLSAAATVSVALLSSRIAAGHSRDLRHDVFNKVTQFSIGEFDKFSTASLLTRTTNDIQQIQTLLVMLPRIIIYAPILGIGGVIKVLNTNTSMGWVIGVAVGAILALVIVLFSIAIPKFKRIQKLIDRLNLVTREFLTGMLVIRAFNNEKHEENKFDHTNKDLTSTSLFINRLMSTMMPMMLLIMNGITLLIVWVGAHQIDAGNMQVGDMMAFIQYTMQIIMAFLMISMISILLPRASVSAQRVAEVLDTEITISNAKETSHFAPNKKGLVEFKNVSFRYPGAEEEVLSNISFTAKPGETTAFVGSTGSGKTTLVNLLLRFFDVTAGEILIEGTDIRKIDLQELREKIGYVPQKGVLFSGTIESNIKYGYQAASEQEVIRSAEISQALEFITTMSEGFRTEIAQGGTNVSGGQRQRLAIARALIKKPDIYLFDDSFSALDYKTDAALRQALRGETNQSTVLIVAQRISSIQHAEKIIVLDEGKIVGIGTHEELMKHCEVYQQIAHSQRTKEDYAS